MRTVPRTPKAGSILVARTVGFADGEVEVVDADTLILDVGVAIVRVTLKTVGRTVTRGTVWAPEVVRVVVVKDDVSLMTVTLGEAVVVEGTEELEDCAETETTKEATRMKGRMALEETRASHGRHQVRGNMMVDGERKRKPQGTEANK